jgi:hypothetical protein
MVRFVHDGLAAQANTVDAKHPVFQQLSGAWFG